MSTENLKVIITGDASELDKASAQAVKALANINRSAAALQKRLSQNLTVNVSATVKSTEELNDSFSKLANTASKIHASLPSKLSDKGDFFTVGAKAADTFNQSLENVEQTASRVSVKLPYVLADKGETFTVGAKKADELSNSLDNVEASASRVSVKLPYVLDDKGEVFTVGAKNANELAQSVDRVASSFERMQSKPFDINSAGVKELGAELDRLIALENKLSIASKRALQPEALQQYNKALADVRGQMNPIAAKLDQLQANTNKIVPAATHASSGFYGLGKSANQANFAMVSLAQGIGDLPYGFSAIANNIQQTVQAFTYLKSSTGGTGSALKALAGSLGGPTGIFVAISAVTAAITYFTNKSRQSTKVIDEIKNKIDELRKGLKDVTDIQGETIQSTAKQSAELNVLYGAATDVTRSQKERLKAAKDLQAAFPKTFGNISQLKIISGQAAGAFNYLATNILKVGQAQAVLDQVVDNYKTIGKATTDIDKMRAKQTELFNNLQKEQSKLEGMGKLSDILTSGSQELIAQWQKQNGRVNEARKALQDYTSKMVDTGKVIQDAIINNQNLPKSFNAIDYKPTGIKETLKTSAKDAKTMGSVLDDLAKKFKQIENEAVGLHYSLDKIASLKVDALTDSYKRLIALGISPANEQLQQMSNLIDALSLKPITPVGFQGIKQTDLDKQFKQDQKAGGTDNPLTVAPPTEEWAKFFKDNQTSTENWMKAGRQLENVFDGIFTTLANGGNIFDALKQAIEQLIIKLTAAAAAAALLSVFTGGGSMAFGSYFSALSGIPKFASGGFIPGPTIAVVGDAPGGEWVLNQKQMKSLLNGAGNNKAVNVSGELRLRGNDLVAAIKRTNDSNSRVN